MCNPCLYVRATFRLGAKAPLILIINFFTAKRLERPTFPCSIFNNKNIKYQEV